MSYKLEKYIYWMGYFSTFLLILKLFVLKRVFRQNENRFVIFGATEFFAHRYLTRFCGPNVRLFSGKRNSYWRKGKATVEQLFGFAAVVMTINYVLTQYISFVVVLN